MACLVIVEGPVAGAHFALASHKVVDIGRDEECTFQIVDPLVSRHHVQIRATGEGVHAVVDSGSANGVLVNGRRISSEVAMKDGDEISIGSTKLVYTTNDYPDAKTAFAGVRPGRQWTAPTMFQK